MIENCALMRHGKYTLRNGSHVLHPETIPMLQHVARDLQLQIDDMPVVIYHSPLKRAKDTADVVYEGLKQGGNTVTLAGVLDWLESDAYSITDQNMAAVPEASEEVFIVFISHQPDIETYLKCDEMLVTNCAVFAQNFTIEGH